MRRRIVEQSSCQETQRTARIAHADRRHNLIALITGNQGILHDERRRASRHRLAHIGMTVDPFGAEIRRGRWPEPRIFALVAEAGGVADDEMVRVFNLGLGMLAVVPDGEVSGALASLAAAGHAAYEVGRIVDGDGVAVVGR